MKHITKKGRHIVAGLGALSLSGMTAHADTEVVHTSLMGDPSDQVISNTANAGNADKQASMALDTYINTLKSEFTWLSISAGQATASPEEQKAELESLVPTFRRIDQLMSQLQATIKQANQTNVTVDVVEKAPATNADQLRNGVENFVEELTKANRIISGKTTIAASVNYTHLLDEANAVLARAAETGVHYEDGILGNLDKIHRKSHDSAQVGTITSTDGPKAGVVVDVTKTKQTNVVTTELETLSEDVLMFDGVDPSAEIAKARDGLLAKIKAANTVDTDAVLKADTYKDNALQNIDRINAWLQKEQDRADNIQKEIEKNMTALESLNAFKTKAIADLDKAKETILASNKSQKIKDKVVDLIEKAKAKVEASGIRENKTDTITAGQNADFGDIGRSVSEIDQLANDLSSNIEGRVTEALKKLEVSNAAAKQEVDAYVADTSDKVTTFADQMAKGGGQVDESWLSTRAIYNQNYNNYQTYIKNALSQTQDVDGSILTKEGNVYTVADGVSTPKAAAAFYALKSAQGLDEGFGSVMLPSANINDFASVSGRKLANSQQFAGGAAGLYNWWDTTRYQGAPLPPAMVDLKRQHIDTVGGDNVFFVISKQPTLTLNLRDSFLYLDGSGEPKTTDMSVTLTVTDENGNRITDGSETGIWVDNLKLDVYYFYYFSVDKGSGKLVAGAGWDHWTGRAAVNGQGGGASAGGGELALGTDGSDPSDDETLQDMMTRYQNFLTRPNDNNAPRNGKGTRLTIHAKVNPVAGAFATNSPLYIGDIDDGQKVETNGDVIIANSSRPTYVANGVVTTNTNERNAHTGEVSMDGQAIMSTSNDAISISRGPKGPSYQAIDIALFAPWGVIGMAPELELDTLNAQVDTFDIADPSARAHTEGSYKVKKVTGVLTPTTGAGDEPLKVTVHTPKFEVPRGTTDGDEVKATYNTSFVVKKLADKVTGYGNTLVVRSTPDSKTTGSGNSLAVRTLTSDKITGSGNSLIVRTLDKEKTSGSGNSLAVRVLEGLATASGSGNSLAVTPLTTPNGLTLDKNLIALTVYVDPSLRKAANEAIKDWQDALIKEGVVLTVTSSPKDSGNHLVILDADGETTMANRTVESQNVRNDKVFEMAHLAGLTVKTDKVGIVDLDKDDKLNRDGDFTVSDLKSNKLVIQINTDAITSDVERVKVIKHEIGHVFGLGHDNTDPLMTSTYKDKTFTGHIALATAKKVADNLKKGYLCDCASCSGVRV